MKLLITKIGLAPILFVQGMFVRRSIPRLPEPQGLRSGISGQGKALRLLVLGDSAAAGVGVAEQDEALLGRLVSNLESRFEVHWKLIAQTGATSNETLRRLEKTEKETFDAVLISLGVNDVTGNRSQRNFIQDQKSIFEILKTKFEARLVIFSGVPPMDKFPALPQPLRWYLGTVGRSFDAALETFTKTQAGCQHLEQETGDDLNLIASDGFHPGAELYSRWAKRAASIIAGRF